MSFRRRIALLTGGAVALVCVLASVGAYAAISDQLHDQVDDSLRERAHQFIRFRARALPPPTGADQLLVMRRPPRVRGNTDFLEQFVAPDGTRIGPAADEEAFIVGSPVRAVAAGDRGEFITDTDVAGDDVRMIVAPLPTGGAVQLGRSLDETATVLARVRLILLLVAIAGVVCAALLGRFVAGRAIAPLRRLTSTAEHVTATGDLARRIEETGHDEIGRLAHRFNEMLDAVQGAVAVRDTALESQRRLVADASHELRTPVTSLRTNIEVMQANPDLDPALRDELLARAAAQAEELTALVSDIIELGRGEETAPGFEEVRLDALVAEAVERAERHAPHQAFDVHLEPVTVDGAPERLARALNNVLDNAVRHNAPGVPIAVTLGTDGSLAVRDHGGGFDPGEVDQVFDRFFRGAATRERSGSGLGLAIVEQVMSGHGGRATAANADGGGALVTLHLPPIHDRREFASANSRGTAQPSPRRPRSG